MVALRGYGSAQRARAVLDEARKVGISDEPYLVIARELVEVFDRRYQAALGVLSSMAPEVFQDQNRFVPRTELYAEVYGLMGNRELARVYYDSARNVVARKLREHPDRSEERRVGEESRSRWAAGHLKKKKINK